MEKPLPDFATALAGYYPANPSPGQDSGVMSPMTPMSTYTQGSTPEQHYVGASPEHLYGIGNPSDSGEYYHVPSSPYPASVNSDEGVVMPKSHSYDHYENFYVSQTYFTYFIPSIVFEIHHIICIAWMWDNFKIEQSMW